MLRALQLASEGLLIDRVLVPFHRGELVSFRPPGWAGHGRPGSIHVPAGCPVLIAEGVGAGRSEVSDLIGELVWVQADQQEAERRSLARVGQPGGRGRPGTIGSGWPRRTHS
jgi:hypothetical protein